MKDTLKLALQRNQSFLRGKEGQKKKILTNIIRNYIESLAKRSYVRRRMTKLDTSNDIGKKWGKLRKN